MKQWLIRLAQSIRHFRRSEDLDDELRAHIEMQIEENLAAGMTRDEAHRQAHVRLGKTQVVIERVHDQDLITAVESWFRDFILGFRALRRNPVFCLTAILTLAIGIGANTTIFTLLYGLLLRSLPVTDAGQLARIGLISAAGPSVDLMIPYRTLLDLREHQRSFTDIAAWGRTAVAIEDGEGTLRRYNAGLVGGNAFSVLGMQAYAGRLIEPADDVRGGPPGGWPAVLSYGFWKDRFAGDPQIIGKQINASKGIVTVVGIAPSEFHGVWPGADPKLYLPFQFINVITGSDVLNAPQVLYGCFAIGRLQRGVTLEAANAEASVYGKGLLDRTIPPSFRDRPFLRTASLKVASARSGLPTFFGRAYSAPLYLMQGLVTIVLLLCCVNVAGLMMSRVYSRRHEFAVRIAVGAGRWRLVRQYLTESFVVALFGALLGAGIAWYGSGVLLPFFRDPMMFEALSVKPDRYVFLVTAISAVLTTLFFGILPALRAGRSDPGTLLKSRTATGGRLQLAGRAFVPIQVGLSLVLVTTATLLSQTLIRIRGEHAGFDLQHVTIQTPPFNQLPQKGDAMLDLYQRMVDRIEQMPGVRAAAVTWQTPMTGRQMTATFTATGGSTDAHMAYNDVGPGYFRTMQTSILAGREFVRSERERTVCVLNQSAAEYLFPHQQAIGKYVSTNDPKVFPQTEVCRVIGLAEDAKFASPRERAPRTIYYPLTRSTVHAAGNLVFLINAGTKPQAIAAYRKAIVEIAPTVPLVLFATLQEQMDAALGSQRLITIMSNIFGGVALFLSAIGLYGLLSASVSQRTAEIGVRVALGAQRSGVLRMILAQAVRLLAAGVAIGAVGLYFGVRFVREMLYGVTAFDPLTLAGAVGVLALVALVAALAPAIRAASVDPMHALRAE